MFKLSIAATVPATTVEFCSGLPPLGNHALPQHRVFGGGLGTESTYYPVPKDGGVHGLSAAVGVALGAYYGVGVAEPGSKARSRDGDPPR